MNSDSNPLSGETKKEILVERINLLTDVPESLHRELLELVDRIEKLNAISKFGEVEALQSYIDWVLKIPFGKYTQDDLDLDQVKLNLDANHFGLQDVKDKIIEFLSIMKLKLISNKDGQDQLLQKTPILLFIGIQGIGKTTMVRSIAKSLGRNFYKISLGGASSVTEIRGVPRGFPQSEPGLILKALINSGSMNPVILLDELDKISDSQGVRADVMSALLEILDSEQNHMFIDRFINHPIDISRCLFIATANNVGGITSALLDRMEIVRFTSYTDEDKTQIGKKYLLPKIRQTMGIGEDKLIIHDDVWPLIIRPLGFDAGIRELERTLSTVARKVARKIVQGEAEKFELTTQNFREFIPDDFGVYA